MTILPLFIQMIFLPSSFSPGKDISTHQVNNSAVITFQSVAVSFGKVKSGEKISGDFIFQNSGNDTLFIKAVLASDGGTIAYWPQEPIAPGSKNVIRVFFGFTESRRGYQDKTFTVISNAQNKNVVLHLTGDINR
jgi:hypothetical protein